MGKGFKVVILGCTGGPREENLSAYLIYPKDHPHLAITFDGGSIISGLSKAKEKGNLSDFPIGDGSLHLEEHVYQNYIRAFLITHAHLDHIAALVLNSQIDKPGKYVIGTHKTISHISQNVYNNVVWPNYGDEGDEPVISIYHYFRLPLFEKTQLPDLPYTVETFPLSHPGDYPCSAFLLEYEGDYVLYVGDTSADSKEKEQYLKRIWERISPLIQKKKLRALFLECSYPEVDAEQAKYGHLSSALFMEEMEHLHKICGEPLDSFKVIVTHRKETLEIAKNKPYEIEFELKKRNHLGLDLIFPVQGERYEF